MDIERVDRLTVLMTVIIVSVVYTAEMRLCYLEVPASCVFFLVPHSWRLCSYHPWTTLYIPYINHIYSRLHSQSSFLWFTATDWITILNNIRAFCGSPCKRAHRTHRHGLMHFQSFPRDSPLRGAGPAQTPAPRNQLRINKTKLILLNIQWLFKNHKTYPVHAFEEKPVVGNCHCSPQRSDERTEVGDILG